MCCLLCYSQIVTANEEFVEHIFICDAGSASYLGSYEKGRDLVDGTNVFINSNDLSFYRNKVTFLDFMIINIFILFYRDFGILEILGDKVLIFFLILYMIFQL